MNTKLFSEAMSEINDKYYSVKFHETVWIMFCIFMYWIVTSCAKQGQKWERGKKLKSMQSHGQKYLLIRL